MEIEGLKTDNYQYYHVIPDTVLCTKELSSNSKVLFTMISGLCNQTGFCWATNAYFAEKLQWSSSTVKRALSELKNLELVIITVKINSVTNQVESRKITTIFRKQKDEVKSDPPSPSNMTHPRVKSDLGNNKNIIIKKNKEASPNFSSFKNKKVTLISDMTFDEWLAWEIKQPDTRINVDSKAQVKDQGDSQKDYFLLMRTNRYNKLCREGKTIYNRNEE